jgi:uncharacterized membrane protein
MRPPDGRQATTHVDIGAVVLDRTLHHGALAAAHRVPQVLLHDQLVLSVGPRPHPRRRPTVVQAVRKSATTALLPRTLRKTNVRVLRLGRAYAAPAAVEEERVRRCRRCGGVASSGSSDSALGPRCSCRARGVSPVLPASS